MAPTDHRHGTVCFHRGSVVNVAVVEPIVAGDAVNNDVVDEIARRVWLNGGNMLAVGREDVPGNRSVAAKLHYAP